MTDTESFKKLDFDSKMALIAEDIYMAEMDKEAARQQKLTPEQLEAEIKAAEAARIAALPPPVVGPEFGGVDVSNDGSVFKKIERVGSEDAGLWTGPPSEAGAIVRVRFVVRLTDGTLVTERAIHKFRLGVNDVVSAWDKAVETMLVGEVCTVVAKPSTVHRGSFSGALGRELPPLPSRLVARDDTPLLFELELLSWRPLPKSLVDISDEDRFEEAQLYKSKGNLAFERGQYADALELYLQACGFLDQHRLKLDERHVWHHSVVHMAHGLLQRCLLNAASAALRVASENASDQSKETAAGARQHSAYVAAEKACTRALADYPKGRMSLKARFRRGRARIGLGEFESARADLSAAREIDPKSRDVIEATRELEVAERVSKQAQKATYANMFASADGLYADAQPLVTPPPTEEEKATLERLQRQTGATPRKTPAEMQEYVLSAFQDALQADKEDERREQKAAKKAAREAEKAAREAEKATREAEMRAAAEAELARLSGAAGWPRQRLPAEAELARLAGAAEPPLPATGASTADAANAATGAVDVSDGGAVALSAFLERVGLSQLDGAFACSGTTLGELRAKYRAVGNGTELLSFLKTRGVTKLGVRQDLANKLAKAAEDDGLV